MNSVIAYQMAAKGKKAEIHIYEDIVDYIWDAYGISARKFVRDLKALGDVDHIDLHINSYGGSVFDGTAIYNAVKDHPAVVAVHIDGIAASIASIIAMAGDTITIAENGYMMIHGPSGIAFGSSEDMRKTADTMDKITDVMVSTYAARSGGDADDIRAMMDEETWFTAEEAVEAGFADTLSANQAMAASLDRAALLNRFKHVPEAAKTPAQMGDEAEPDMPRLLSIPVDAGGDPAQEALPPTVEGAGNADPGAVEPEQPAEGTAQPAPGDSIEPEDGDGGGDAVEPSPESRALRLRAKRMKRRRSLARAG